MSNVSPCKIFSPPGRQTCGRPSCFHCDFIRKNLWEKPKDSVVLSLAREQDSEKAHGGFGLHSGKAEIESIGIVASPMAESMWVRIRDWMRAKMRF